MKRNLLILAVAALGIVSCGNNEPQYANRAEKIVAEIHNPASKYVVVACHRGGLEELPGKLHSCHRVHYPYGCGHYGTRPQAHQGQRSGPVS